MKRIVWTLLYALALLLPKRPRLSILVYHSIANGRDFFAVTPDRFRQQLAYLRSRFAVADLNTVQDYLAGKPLGRDTVVLTFDDGYKDFATTVVPILRELHMPAAVFLIAGDVNRSELGSHAELIGTAERTLVRDALVTIGSHSLTHPKLTRVGEETLRTELKESKLVLEREYGVAVDTIAYPKGAYNRAVLEGARAAGYRLGLSVEQRSVDRGDDPLALPRIQIDSSTSPLIFRAKLSRAQDWYYALWRLFRRL